MRFCFPLGVVAALCLLSPSVPSAAADIPPKTDPTKPASEKAPLAVEKALAFLVKDTAKWRKERNCATCHHGVLTVSALSEAKSQGYSVAAEELSEITAWTRDHFVPRFSKPRDPRFGWNLVSMPAIYLGMMSQTLPILSRDETRTIADHLARHQEEDGAWLTPPPANGPPPFWESRETVALLALLAWEPGVAPASREKALAWLASNKPAQTTQATSLRLLLDLRSGKPAEQVRQGIDALFKRQNADGGWSLFDGLPSDAYSTGQSLWVLSFARIEKDRSDIARAVSFLVASQKENGSWAMTSRDHSGGVKKKNPMPITYFGSAWATLGLVRFVPPALDPAARQKQAIAEIQRLNGTFEVDGKSPDKPVVRVTIAYEVDDAEVAGLSARLTAFPQLTTLEFKSPKITDAGLAHLKSLSQLRSLSLEGAAVTDAGLVHLKELTYLEALNVKGTKVTDGGVEELKKALPKAKVDR